MNVVAVVNLCSQKASQGGQNTQRTNSPPVNSTMVYEGAALEETSSASPSKFNHVFGSHAIAGVISITVALWGFF